MAVKPESPALSRMAKKINDSSLAVDVKKDIDRFKFTTEDLIQALPMYRAQKLGGVDMTVSSADLMLASKEDMLSMLCELRAQRCETILKAFTGPQLKQYLRQHKLSTSGTKGEMVSRILDKVWSISLKTLEMRFSTPKGGDGQDGMTLPLSKHAMDLLRALDSKFLSQLEIEFGVKIVVHESKQEVRVSGAMHHVRGALSTLREKLTADTTVQVDLAKYGTPRVLSPKHVGRIIGTLNRAVDGTLSHMSGEYFARGDRPIVALEAQRALVGAMVEPTHRSLFAVVPECIVDSHVCTMTPTADPFSQPLTFVPDMEFYTVPSTGAPTPVSLLARHTLYEIAADGAARRSNLSLTQALQSWAAEQTCVSGQLTHVSAKLGKVMVDMDCAHKRLGTRFYSPKELLEAVVARSPLFGFSSSVTPLKWLQGPGIRESPRKQVVLRFELLEHSPLPNQQMKQQAQTSDNAKYRFTLPVSSDRDVLVARVDVRAGKADFDSLKLSHVSGKRTANVVILQPAQDLQICVSSQQRVDVSTNLAKALEHTVRGLGTSSHGNDRHAVTCRHDVIETHLGRFALESAKIVDVSSTQLGDGVVVCVQQKWDVIDDLRYSQVELLPAADGLATMSFVNSQDEWERYLLHLFQAALERPSTPSIALGGMGAGVHGSWQ
ncbi:hypothetical protein GGI02_000277 [Coemansia sp. RSA 2322]|nr:hypothetical protein GGI02_000277 [Coemansia sp. RSA 2322]